MRNIRPAAHRDIQLGGARAQYRAHYVWYCLNMEMRFSSFSSLEKDMLSHQTQAVRGKGPTLAIATALFTIVAIVYSAQNSEAQNQLINSAGAGRHIALLRALIT